jgi:hypothetical protein
VSCVSGVGADDEPSKALLDRLTIAVIEAAGDLRDPNHLITIALKVGYRAGKAKEASVSLDARTVSAMKTLKVSGLSHGQIADRYDLAPEGQQVAF